MRKSLLVLAALPLLTLAWVASPAFAQAADGVVTIPWGEWLSASAGTLATLAASVLALALARLPASVLAMVKTWQVDQLLERSISYGINMVAQASKGQSLSVPVANDVIEKALDYAVSNGSASIIKWMGGKDMVRNKIIARIDVASEAPSQK